MTSIIGTLPSTLLNGTVNDATQVMLDLNWIVNQVNSNAQSILPSAKFNKEIQTATAGQTLFVLSTMTYTPGINGLVVYVNGILMNITTDYLESSVSSFTFTSGLSAGDVVTAFAGTSINSSITEDASLVSYTPYGATPTVTNVRDQLQGANTTTPDVRGFWKDQVGSANIHRFRDRAFVGDGAAYTGNQNAPFGSTQLSTTIANWPEPNSQFISESQNGKIGILGTSMLITGQTSGSSIAVAGFARAQLAGGTSRALYGDATLETGATAVYGAEIATANRGTNTVANSYTAAAGAYGILIAQESAIGYLLGDSSTPAADSSSPGTAAIIIKAGAGATSVHQYNSGLVFFSNSLVGNDGTTGTSEAISFGKGMAMNWYASSSILGASIRSDVTAVANHDVSIIFTNDTISLNSTSSASSVPMLQLTRDTVSAGGVNYLTLANARTGTNVVAQVAGSDTNAGYAIKTKGTGVGQFFTNGTEALRIASNPASAVNFMQVVGSATGGPVIVSFQGTDTNGDVAARGKGTGGGQLQDGGTAVKFQWNTTGVGFFAATPAGQTSGWGVPTGNAVVAAFPGATATLVQCSNVIAQLIVDLKKWGLYAA